jgi:hypothetical protein
MARDRLVGFSGHRWGKQAEIVWERLRVLVADPDVHVAAVVADVNVTGGGSSMMRAGVTVITEREIRAFGRSVLEPKFDGTPDLVLSVDEIVGVDGPTFTNTIKLQTRTRGRVVGNDKVAKGVAEILRVFWTAHDVSVKGLAFLYLGGTGYPIPEGCLVRAWLEPDAIVISTPDGRGQIEVPYDRLTSVETGGPGVVTTGGGFAGGGFGLAGFAIGAVAAGAMNALTTRTRVQTLLRVETLDGEMNLFTSETTPDDLDLQLADARLHIRRRAAVPAATDPDPLERLERLARLRRDGVLSDEEFDTQKQRLLEQMQ